MAKNKLADLNNHLFAQLERLTDEDLSGDDLQREIDRSRAVSTIARDVIASGTLAVRALEAAKEWNTAPPELLGIGDQ